MDSRVHRFIGWMDKFMSRPGDERIVDEAHWEGFHIGF
jgi:hypothetical protein